MNLDKSLGNSGFSTISKLSNPNSMHSSGVSSKFVPVSKEFKDKLIPTNEDDFESEYSKIESSCEPDTPHHYIGMVSSVEGKDEAETELAVEEKSVQSVSDSSSSSSDADISIISKESQKSDHSISLQSTSSSSEKRSKSSSDSDSISS